MTLFFGVKKNFPVRICVKPNLVLSHLGSLKMTVAQNGLKHISVFEFSKYD